MAKLMYGINKLLKFINTLKGYAISGVHRHIFLILQQFQLD